MLSALNVVISVIMLAIVLLTIYMLNDVPISVIILPYTEICCIECRYAGVIVLNVLSFAYQYAVCRYGACRCAECYGIINIVTQVLLNNKIISGYFV